MHERIRNAFLGLWGRTVADKPRLTLTLFLIGAIISIVVTVLHLEFKADRSDLVDPNLSWNKAYSRYKQLNERWNDLTICLDGPAVDERVDALAQSISRQLSQFPDRIIAADAGFDIAETGPGLFAVAPRPIFDQVLSDLTRAHRLTAAENATAALGYVLGDLAQESENPDKLEVLEQFLEPFLTALNGGNPDFSFLRPDVDRWHPLVSEEGSGRLRFIQVQLQPVSGIDAVSDHLAWLRDQVHQIVSSNGLADIVQWGVTGIPAIEADETNQSIHDSTLASIIAMIAITILMLVVFRGFVVPMLAAGSLLIGLALSFGWLVLVVGHLQLLSVVFTVILMGLGIDFALHLVARLELVKDEHDTLPSAIARVFRGIGPGMLTGAVTTAAAFGVTTFTQFKGMAEMGLIAGGGILLCLLAMLSCFPAALAVTGRWKKIIRHRPGGETAHFAHGRLDFVDRRPRRTLTMTLIPITLLAWAGTEIRYDPNVLNLQPPGVESVEWEHRIVADDARSVWAALVWTDVEHAAQYTDELSTLPMVSGVGAMGLLFPEDRAERSLEIEALQNAPNPVITAESNFTMLQQQLAAVGLGLTARLGNEDSEINRRLETLAQRISEVVNSSAQYSADQQDKIMAELSESFVTSRQALSLWLDEALSLRSLGPNDLPTFLRDQWAPEPGRWLLQVFPAPDEQGHSILHPDRLGPFVHSIRQVVEILSGSPQAVFGPPVQIYESSQLIQREYIKAAIYAIAAILILLLIDFRSLPDALCAMLPVTIGFIGVFGMLGLTGFTLNFANIIVMPLIFGIGVDVGVHMVHRWRQEPYGRPAGLSGATGRGITLTMLTTMIGFASMLLAQHRGIRSLGFVMVIGLGVTLCACYLVLPAVLRLRAAAPTEAMRYSPPLPDD